MRGPWGQAVIHNSDLRFYFFYAYMLQIYKDVMLCSQGDRGTKGLKGLKGAAGFKVNSPDGFNSDCNYTGLCGNRLMKFAAAVV